MIIQFFVPGIPRPGGSKVRTKWGVREAGKHTANWRSVVSDYAMKAMEGRDLFTGPVSVSMEFIFLHPKNHYRTGKFSHLLKDNAPYWKTTMPDTTKLVRSTEDALKSIVWCDDSQVVIQYNEKHFSKEKSGVIIIVKETPCR